MRSILAVMFLGAMTVTASAAQSQWSSAPELKSPITKKNQSISTTETRNWCYAGCSGRPRYICRCS